MPISPFRLLLLALMGFVRSPTAAQTAAAPHYLTTDFGKDAKAPGSCEELTISSHGSRLAAFMYTAPGPQPHPTLILLHGLPGNERNLDIAQSVRRAGWNVLYFDYRGSWGSEGDFSFANCVEDVASAVAFCKQQAQTLHIDTARLALFGHSMGGWVALKALAQQPGIKKAIILSPMNIYAVVAMSKTPSDTGFETYVAGLFMLHNTSGHAMLAAVQANTAAYELAAEAVPLSTKQLVFLDENRRNEQWIKVIGAANKASFRYEIWDTDHPFSNKRIALTKTMLEFLNK